jgi:hypothetical protein
MLYAIRDLLLDIRNVQTKYKFIQLFKQYSDIDSSMGLAYRDGRFILKHIY